MKNQLLVIGQILIAGFGLNQWLSHTHADQVLTTIDQQAERNTRQTMVSVSDTVNTTIEKQFVQDRKIRDRESDRQLKPQHQDHQSNSAKRQL